MFTEILKIIPKLDSAALSEMEASLGKRFKKLAKSFGSGLKDAILGGGVTALALGVINKLLNPLQETQDTVERLLEKSNSLSEFAKQFGTTSGNLFKLEQLAGAKGIGPDELRVLLVKFQDAVVNAKADTSKPSAVRNFVDQKDTAEAFFGFVQSMQKLTKEQQNYVQQEVFGGKQILKMAEFLNTPNFALLARQIGLKDASAYTTKIETGAALSDTGTILKARRETKGFEEEVSKLSVGMISSQDVAEQKKLAQESKNLSAYDALKALQTSMDDVQRRLQDGVLVLIKHAPQIAEGISKIANSRLIRGATGGKGEK